MGKGIALSFKERYPEMFRGYKAICDQNLLEPGKLWLWQGSEHWILNFPTKIHWRNPSRIEWIESGLKKFVAGYESLGIRDISFPRLGCGNGGLNWDDVRPLMEHYLSPLPIQIFIHDFTVDIGLPEHLEDAARKLRKEKLTEPTFETFLLSLRRALELVGNDLVDLDSKAPFTAYLTDDGLRIDLPETSWLFELEDLRGVWVGLSNGLVTKEKAGWSVAEGGKSLISLLSVLPQVRPIQIQKSSDSKPELALELRPQKRQNAVAPQSKEQYDLTWG